MTQVTDSPYAATSAVKMHYLIRRRPQASREELVANWFANHMPAVVKLREQLKAAGHGFPRRYLATLFQPDAQGQQPWDGVAQLWWDQTPPDPEAPYGTEPADTFQQKAEPYSPWATTEYVVLDDGGRLPCEPNTLNAPWPATRSGFYKINILVAARAGADHTDMARHWLCEHAGNVVDTLGKVGGFRYVVSLSREPSEAPFAGLAELYFESPEGWRGFLKHSQPDGFEQFMDMERTLILPAETEMIGIPGE